MLEKINHDKDKIALLLITLLFCLFSLSEPGNSDDIAYFYNTRQVYNDLLGLNINIGSDFSYVNSHLGLRLGIYILTLPLQFLYGYSLIGYTLSSLTISLLLVALIYKFSYLLFGKYVATLSLIFCCMSFSLSESISVLGPDSIGLIYVLSALCILIGNKNSKLYELIFVGLLLSMAWATRSTYIFFSISIFLLFLQKQIRFKQLLIVAVGSVLGLVIEMIWINHVSGDYFTRINLLFGYGDVVETVSVFSALSIFDFIIRYPDFLNYHSSFDFYCLIIFIIGSMWIFYRKKQSKYFVFLICHVIFLAIPIVFLFRLDEGYMLKPFMREKLRYYAVLSPFIMISCAYVTLKFCSYINDNLPKSKMFLKYIKALVILVVAVNLSLIFKSHSIFNGHNAPYTSLFSQELSEIETLYSDNRSMRKIEIFNETKNVAIFPDCITTSSCINQGHFIFDWKRINANFIRSYEGYKGENVLFHLNSVYSKLDPVKVVTYDNDSLELLKYSSNQHMFIEEDIKDFQFCKHMNKGNEIVRRDLSSNSNKDFFATTCSKIWKDDGHVVKNNYDFLKFEISLFASDFSRIIVKEYKINSSPRMNTVTRRVVKGEQFLTVYIPFRKEVNNYVFSMFENKFYKINSIKITGIKFTKDSNQ